MSFFSHAKPNEESIELPPDDRTAIEEALADVARGDRGISFDEFDRDFRNRHQLPGLS